MSNNVDFNVINESALGNELDEQECQILASTMKVQKVKANDIVVQEGQDDNTLFLLAEGRLSVISRMDGKESPVYTMSPGECSGTRAFVDRAPRKATLKAKTDVTLYTLEPEYFESLLDSHPRVVYKVMRAIFRITHMNLMRMNSETRELSNYIQKTHGRY